MKRILVLFAFILTATFANAQATQAPAPPTERAHTQALSYQKMLALTAEQLTQVEAIILAKINAIDEINNDATRTQEQKDADAATVRSQKEKEIMAVLTPEQQQKYTDIKNQRKQRKQTLQNQE